MHPVQIVTNAPESRIALDDHSSCLPRFWIYIQYNFLNQYFARRHSPWHGYNIYLCVSQEEARKERKGKKKNQQQTSKHIIAVFFTVQRQQKLITTLLSPLNSVSCLWCLVFYCSKLARQKAIEQPFLV